MRADPALHWVVWVLSAVLVFFAVAQAWSHESPDGWSYPFACCSGQDCAPLEDSRVKELGDGGYMVDEKFYVPPAQVKQSGDSRFHACFPADHSWLRCFFAPSRGS